MDITKMAEGGTTSGGRSYCVGGEWEQEAPVPPEHSALATAEFFTFPPVHSPLLGHCTWRQNPLLVPEVSWRLLIRAANTGWEHWNKHMFVTNHWDYWEGSRECSASERCCGDFFSWFSCLRMFSVLPGPWVAVSYAHTRKWSQLWPVSTSWCHSPSSPSLTYSFHASLSCSFPSFFSSFFDMPSTEVSAEDAVVTQRDVIPVLLELGVQRRT